MVRKSTTVTGCANDPQAMQEDAAIALPDASRKTSAGSGVREQLEALKAQLRSQEKISRTWRTQFAGKGWAPQSRTRKKAQP